MKFSEFVKEYAEAPIIDSKTFTKYGSPGDVRRQVRRWVQKDQLIPLKRGLYILNKEYKKTEADPMFIANQLVQPSYVSLTYALWHYGMIPERAVVVTSVTTKKTREYKNDTGRYEYRSIKRKAFKGYIGIKVNNRTVFIASAEKALIDYFYYFPEKNPGNEYFESLRLQNLEQMDPGAITSFKGLYNSRIDSVIELFLTYLQDVDKGYRKL